MSFLILKAYWKLLHFDRYSREEISPAFTTKSEPSQ
jgi:hypothetical protein